MHYQRSFLSQSLDSGRLNLTHEKVKNDVALTSMRALQSTSGRERVPVASQKEDFYEQMRQFKIQNGYLLRMLQDGQNVILSDEIKNKLYMSTSDAFAAEILV